MPEHGTAEKPLVYRGLKDVQLATVTGAEHVWFIDCTFTSVTINALPSKNGRTENVHFIRCTTTGPVVLNNGGKNVSFWRHKFRPTSTAKVAGIYAVEIDGLRIEQSSFVGIGGKHPQNQTHDAYLLNCADALIYGNLFKDGGLSLKLSSNRPGGFDGALVEGNTWDGCAEAIELSFTASEPELGHRNIKIVSNLVKNPGRELSNGQKLANGFRICSAEIVAVLRNTFQGPPPAGYVSFCVLVGDRHRDTGELMPSKNIVIQGNLIEQWSDPWKILVPDAVTLDQ